MEQNGSTTMEALYQELIGEDVDSPEEFSEEVDDDMDLMSEALLPEIDDDDDFSEVEPTYAMDTVDLEPTDPFESFDEGSKRERANRSRSLTNARNISRQAKVLNREVRINRRQDKQIKGLQKTDRRVGKQIRSLNVRETKRYKATRRSMSIERSRVRRMLKAISGRIDTRDARINELANSVSTLQLTQIIQPLLYRIRSIELSDGAIFADGVQDGTILLNPGERFEVESQENDILAVLVPLFLPLLFGGGSGLTGGGDNNSLALILPVALLVFAGGGDGDDGLFGGGNSILLILLLLPLLNQNKK